MRVMKSNDAVGVQRFGVFEFDPTTGELRKHGLQIRISHQAAQLLAFLLESPGRIRSREELEQRLWPGNTFVDFEHSLNKVAFTLREALGDSATNPRFIETIVGQGYRFITIPQVLGGSVLKGGAARRMESLSVLPFVSERPEPELEFLSHQITLNLIDRLSRSSGLGVLAYSTVKRYQQQGEDPAMVGRDLGV